MKIYSLCNSYGHSQCSWIKMTSADQREPSNVADYYPSPDSSWTVFCPISGQGSYTDKSGVGKVIRRAFPKSHPVLVSVLRGKNMPQVVSIILYFVGTLLPNTRRVSLYYRTANYGLYVLVDIATCVQSPFERYIKLAMTDWLLCSFSPVPPCLIRQ